MPSIDLIPPQGWDWFLPTQFDSSAVSARNTLSLRSAACPIWVIGRLAQLLPPLASPLGLATIRFHRKVQKMSLTNLCNQLIINEHPMIPLCSWADSSRCRVLSQDPSRPSWYQP